MSGLICTAVVEDVLITGSDGAKTKMQLVAPTNQRFNLLSLSIFFSGTDATLGKVSVNLHKQSSIGVGSSAITPQTMEVGASETPQVTALGGFTTEPTTVAQPIKAYRIAPVDGVIEIFDLGEIEVLGGNRIGMVIDSPSGVDVNVTIESKWRE